MTRNPHLPREREDFTEVGAHCPVCGSEYRPGFDTCADDGTPLVRGAAPQEGPWSAPEGREPTAVPSGPQVAAASRLPWEDAWLLAGRLQSEGLDATVYPPDYGSTYPHALADGFDVLVPEAQVGDARVVIEAIAAEPPAEDTSWEETQ